MKNKLLKKISRIILITFLAMFLNGEYFAYGPALVVQGLLIVFYLSYVLTIDSLIRLFNLRSRQIFLLGAGFGLLIEGFFHQSFYSVPPLIFGVNWIVVLIQIFAWGLLATLMAFSLGERLIPRAPTSNKRRGILSLIISIFVLSTLLVLWATKLTFPKTGGVVLIFILILGILFFRARKREKEEVMKVKLIDWAIGLYLIIEIIVGTFIRQIVDPVYAVAVLLLGGLIIISFREKSLK